MTEHKRSRRHKVLEKSVEELHLENGDAPGRLGKEIKEEATISDRSSPRDTSIKSSSQSPMKMDIAMQSPSTRSGKLEEVVGGEVTVKLEPGHPPKLARSTSHKIISKPAPLFHDYPSKTEESKHTFQLLEQCSYTSKYIGSTEHGSMDCDCTEEWDGFTKTNSACGHDSDCINRATKMECVGDCGCGADCQNQRFQQQQFADVTVFKTEKKGYGLRADTDLNPDDFIYEYIGEVIDEARFRRRMVQYDEEGIKHFYFMSLTKGEFVDATKKGNLGRFCNHSCNPNCYVDKWVVGEKLRMGIFAERKIKAGEELVFNYNVDRYGTDPQPCYCGEPNCTGFIGGKTQTERATKLSNTTIEALGIEDGDGWDTAVAKKTRKKKVGEEDEEYVNNVQPKSLDEDGVTKVMATLMQCREKWIAVKLLGRIQRCDDERVRNRVVKMHGYQILNSALTLWKEDFNVVLQVFDILGKFPLLTRNKINDSKIEITVESFKACGDDMVELQAQGLLDSWSKLEVAYRIPRKKRDVLNNTTTTTPEFSTRSGRRDSSREERKARSRSRSRSKSRSRSRSIDAPKGPAAPNGPRSNFPQRGPGFYNGPRGPYRPRPFGALPEGWFAAQDDNGRTYYYDLSGKTTWQRPTMIARPPPPPPKPTSTNKALEDIINQITSAKANTPKEKTTPLVTPQAVNGDAEKDTKGGPEKWRTYSEDKQKKLYENTLFPHIKYVMDKFKGKLLKDDLKRFAKEISKKLVSSDFKNHRVEDPTKISSRQEKHVKKYVKEYFDKAVAKKREHEKKKAERRSKEGESAVSPTPPMVADAKREEEESDGDQDMAMSDDDEDEKPKLEPATPVTPSDQLSQVEGLKRKRVNDEDPDSIKLEDNEATPSKRLKSESPPPPPPPPPADGTPPDSMSLSNGGTDDVNRHSYEANKSSGNTESMGESPENHGDGLPYHATSKESARAVNNDVDISGNAHTPDTPSDLDYAENGRLFGSNGQRHVGNIEVHGGA
ncbi:MAG: histone methyltransferase set2 [Alectoria fallacina]|uniref:Histone-lysine N-methyltransferase, H3 lysine-36 specific n=1 Tax=Alectoria fallacina TaxID=1903189 RepID=A0A8H3IB11_9LECA|nr:MAG: histone methyltransferase set2 [Alectoria fallacina]